MPKSFANLRVSNFQLPKISGCCFVPFDTFSLDLDTSALIRGWWIIDLAIDVAFVGNCDFQPGGFRVFLYFKV